MDPEVITRSLTLVSERCPDPTGLVFGRLFAENPEMEALFVRDTGGLVRGQMLAVALDCVLDFVTNRTYGANLIEIERVNHEGLGVPPEVFDRFFGTVVDAFRDLVGADWTADIDTSWREVLAAIRD